MKKPLKKILYPLTFLSLFLLSSCSYLESMKDSFWFLDDTCTVLFYNFNGEFLSRQDNVEKGSSVVYTGPIPTKSGDDEFLYYSFKGWDKDLTNVTKDTITYATFYGYNDKEDFENFGKPLLGSEFKEGAPEYRYYYYGETEESKTISYEDDNYFYYYTLVESYENVTFEGFNNSVYYSSNFGIKEFDLNRMIPSAEEINKLVKTYCEGNVYYTSEDNEYVFKRDLNKLSLTYWTNSFQIDSGFTFVYNHPSNIFFDGEEELVFSYIDNEFMSDKRVMLTSEDKDGYYHNTLTLDVSIYLLEIKNREKNEIFYQPLTHIFNPRYNLYYSENEFDDTFKVVKSKFDVEKCYYNKFLLLDGSAPYIGKIDSSRNIFISTAYGLLMALNNNISNEANIYLSNDIDFNGATIDPIRAFSGTLNGNNNKLKNFRINGNLSSANNKIGLISNLYGSVKDLTLENVTLEASIADYDNHIYAGLISGNLNNSTSWIYNVKVLNSRVSITYETSATSGKYYLDVGAIVGRLSNGKITSTVVSNTSVIGDARINTSSSSVADVWCHVGGVIGTCQDGTFGYTRRDDDCIIQASTRSGSKTSAYHCHAGGIIGYYNSGYDLGYNESSEVNVKAEPIVVSDRKANSSTSNAGAIKGN